MRTWAAKATRIAIPAAKAVMIKARVLICFESSVWSLPAHSLSIVMRVIRLMGTALATLALSSCASDNREVEHEQSAVLQSPATSAPTPETAPPTSGLATEFPSALEALRSKTLSGETFNPASLIGSDVLIWFWAPW